MSTDTGKPHREPHGLGKNPFEGMKPLIEAARQEEAAPTLEPAEPQVLPKPTPTDPIQRARALAALNA
ncbi:MAG: hypothetical protein ACUVT1_12930, partial [Anaerolineae bacterium]